MQRRSALKNLSIGFGGLICLPAWASGWTAESIGRVSTASSNEEGLMAELVETILPQTDTPGAKALNVHQFVLRMIQDCYDQTAQTTLQQGLVLVDATAQENYHKTFASCSATERKDVLSKLTTATDPVGKAFVDQVKSLVIWGYTNSEFYLTTVQHYTMAPGFYHGCVPV